MDAVGPGQGQHDHCGWKDHQPGPGSGQPDQVLQLHFLARGRPWASVILLVAMLMMSMIDQIPQPPRTQREIAIANANRNCASLWGMRPVARQPKGIVFTFGDLSPRLIAVTHHRANIGPYHRNGEAIIDVMKAFRGTPDQARALVRKHRADYLLICPMMSQSTVFSSAAPNGFYVQLAKGKVPAWLQPIDLGKDSPMKMWKVVG